MGEYLTIKLQKQIDAVLHEKNEVLKRLDDEEKRYSTLRVELNDYREKLKKSETQHNIVMKRNNRLRREVEQLRTDNFVLNQRFRNENERFNQMKREKFFLEADMERQSEREFNAHTRYSDRSNNSFTDEDSDHLMSTSMPTSRGFSVPVRINTTNPFTAGSPPEDDDLFMGSPVRGHSQFLGRPVASSPIGISSPGRM